MLDKFDPNIGWWAAAALVVTALWRSLLVGQRIGSMETKLDHACVDIATLQADVKEILRHTRK